MYHVCMSFTLKLNIFCYIMAIQIQTEYEARQHFEWPHVSSQALLRNSSSHTTSDLCTGGLRFLHQVQYRFNLSTHTNVDLKTSKLKWGWGVLNMYPIPLLSTLLIEAW